MRLGIENFQKSICKRKGEQNFKQYPKDKKKKWWNNRKEI